MLTVRGPGRKPGAPYTRGSVALTGGKGESLVHSDTRGSVSLTGASSYTRMRRYLYLYLSIWFNGHRVSASALKRTSPSRLGDENVIKVY